MRRSKSACESCLPGVPCVLHGLEPRHHDDENDTPAAKRYDSRRVTIEREARQRVPNPRQEGGR